MLRVKTKKYLFCFILVLLILNFYTPFLSLGFSNDCEELLTKSPKTSVIDEASKNIIAGFAAGTIACLLSKDKKNCPLYIIGGGIVGTMYSINKYNLLILKTPFQLPKEYRPPFFQLNNIQIVDHNTLQPKYIFREKEYIMLVIRHTLLDYKPEEAVWVRYIFHFYRDTKHLGTFGELVPLIQGETANPWLFPVCPGAIKGKYKLKVEVIALGKKEVGEVEWEVR
jgi:hypothetical protein